MVYKNLVAGQWQVGDLVMGYGTNIIVQSVDAKPYDINAQDYQVARADEARFGFDQFKPTTIELTLQVLHNRLLPGWEAEIPNFWHSMPDLYDLAREWRFDEGRQIWGQMKPLYHCSKLDGIPKIIFGRPGQFSYTVDDMFNRGEVMNVLAEFRRGDTLSYSIYETGVNITQGNLVRNINGTAGNGPSWMRVLLTGPINDPIFTLTNMWQQNDPIEIEFDYNVAAGETVEISGYPWSRRVVNNLGVNLSAKMVGETPYLDRLRFNFNAPVEITMAGGGITSETKAAVLWRDSYQVI